MALTIGQENNDKLNILHIFIHTYIYSYHKMLLKVHASTNSAVQDQTATFCDRLEGVYPISPAISNTESVPEAKVLDIYGIGQSAKHIHVILMI